MTAFQIRRGPEKRSFHELVLRNKQDSDDDEYKQHSDHDQCATARAGDVAR